MTGTLALLLGGAFVAWDPVWVLAILLSGTLVGLSLGSFPWLIALVLILRTYLDAYTDEYFLVGSVRISAAAVFSLFMTGLIVWSFLASRSSIPNSRGIRGLSILIVGSFVAVFTAYARLGETGNVALRELVRLLMLLIWYIFLYEKSRRTGKIQPFQLAVLLACPIPLIMGFVDVFRGTKFDAEGATRISSTFVNPNSYGTYLVFLIMFAFARLSTKPDWVSRLILALALPSLVLTYSRGAWVAFLVAAPLYWIYVSKHRWRAAIIFVMLVVAAYPILEPRMTAVDYRRVLNEAQMGVTSNSFSFRMMIWKELIGLWELNPVLGWGLGSTPTINPIRVFQESGGYAAHNDAVRHLVETGLLGFTCYLIFLTTLGVTLFGLAMQFKGTHLQSYSLAAFATFIAIVVESFTVGDPLLESSFMFHFLGLAAVLEGLSAYSSSRSRHSHSESLDFVPI